jgi:hypothetical protein
MRREGSSGLVTKPVEIGANRRLTPHIGALWETSAQKQG